MNIQVGDIVKKKKQEDFLNDKITQKLYEYDLENIKDLEKAINEK